MRILNYKVYPRTGLVQINQVYTELGPRPSLFVYFFHDLVRERSGDDPLVQHVDSSIAEGWDATKIRKNPDVHQNRWQEVNVIGFDPSCLGNRVFESIGM